MKLPWPLSKLDSPAKKDYLFAVSIGLDSVGAAIWSTSRGEPHIEGQAQQKYSGGWEEIIAAVDTALSEACSKLAFGNEVEKVIFGLSPDFTDGEHIASQHLVELKRLCRELSLKAIGFVVIPEALSFYLSKDEGIPQTAILVAVSSKSLHVSLFRVGKCVGMTTVTRSGANTQDLEQALLNFANVEVLPSKIILYDEESNLAKVRDELLDYPWQNKAAFLHFPKIEVLPTEITIAAVVEAGATELRKQQALGGDAAAEQLFKKEPLEGEKKAPAQELVQYQQEEPAAVKEEEKSEPPTQRETTSVFGFLREKDVVLEEAPKSPEREESDEKSSESVAPPRNFFRYLSLPHISLPHIQMHGLRVSAIVFVLLLFLIGGIIVSLYVTIPSATIHVLVDPQILTRDFTIKLDTKGETSEDTIAATSVEVEVEGQKKTVTTGKKIVGDKATGEVTMYNKTTNEKIFPKGSTLVGPKNLQFTLDSETIVASVSDVIVGTPGKAKVKVTAVNIGTEGNLPASSDFAVKDFPLNLYAGRNEQAFVGGTSREVQVVSKKDQDSAVKKILADLDEEIKAKIVGQLGREMQLFHQSINTAISKKIFSHEVGAEATEFETQLSVKAKAVAYKKEMIDSFIRKNLASLVPPQYTLASDTPSFTATGIKVNNEGLVTFTASVKATLLPIISREEVKKSLLGKSLEEVEKMLRANKTIVGYEVIFTKELPFAKKVMPQLGKNLTVEVRPR